MPRPFATPMTKRRFSVSDSDMNCSHVMFMKSEKSGADGLLIRESPLGLPPTTGAFYASCPALVDGTVTPATGGRGTTHRTLLLDGTARRGPSPPPAMDFLSAPRALS